MTRILTFDDGFTSGTPPTVEIGNEDIADDAGIEYSKLDLTDSIVNADVNTSAAIAWSKLDTTGQIVNADVNATAEIAYEKLDLANGIVDADVNTSAEIAYSKLDLSDSIVNADINGSASIAPSKLNVGSGVDTWMSTPSSANLYSAMTDKTGTAGTLVFSTAPTFTGEVTMSGNLELTGTSHLKLPAGTDAQRPGTPTEADIRYNTDSDKAEIYNGAEWEKIGGGGLVPTSIDKDHATTLEAGKSYIMDSTGATATIELDLPNGAAESAIELSFYGEPVEQMGIVPASGETITLRDGRTVTSSDRLLFGVNTSKCKLEWDSDNSTWIANFYVPDANGNLNGSWVITQDLEVKGDLTVDTVDEYTTDNGVQIQGNANGSNAASGYFGEMLGTQRSGTDGSSYSVRSTNQIGAGSYADVLTITLQPGRYLVGYSIYGYHSAVGNQVINHRITLDDTEVTYNGSTSWDQDIRSELTKGPVPILITGANTELAVEAKFHASITHVIPINELWVIRIA